MFIIFQINIYIKLSMHKLICSHVFFITHSQPSNTWYFITHVTLTALSYSWWVSMLMSDMRFLNLYKGKLCYCSVSLEMNNYVVLPGTSLHVLLDTSHYSGNIIICECLSFMLHGSFTAYAKVVNDLRVTPKSGFSARIEDIACINVLHICVVSLGPFCLIISLCKAIWNILQWKFSMFVTPVTLTTWFIHLPCQLMWTTKHVYCKPHVDLQWYWLFLAAA